MARVAKNKRPKFPYSMTDNNALIKSPLVAVEIFPWGAVLALYKSLAYNIITSHMIYPQFQPGGAESCYTLAPKIDAKKVLEEFRDYAVSHGCDPDVVEYLAAVRPFTKPEEKKMAATAKAKTTKSTTKKPSKPVGKGGKLQKNKGNPEALKKAREARAAKTTELHGKKLTVAVKKTDDLKLRGGRLAKLEALIKQKPKTVGDALEIGTVKDETGKEHKMDMGALRGMEKRGHIKIG